MSVYIRVRRLRTLAPVSPSFLCWPDHCLHHLLNPTTSTYSSYQLRRGNIIIIIKAICNAQDPLRRPKMRCPAARKCSCLYTSINNSCFRTFCVEAHCVANVWLWLFNIRSLKTLFQSLFIKPYVFISSYCTFYALCFIFSAICVFHCYSTL